MSRSGKWFRTAARMTVTSHRVELEHARNAGLGSYVRVEWPDDVVQELAIHCAVWERQGPWAWSIVRAGKVLDKGTANGETGARSAVRRRVKKLVEETRKLPAIAALEAKLIERKTTDNNEWRATEAVSF